MGPCEIVTVAAPAKVNLYLHVVGRRADGYHLLDSLVVFTALGDTVSVRRAKDLRLSVDGPFAAAPALVGENIVLRAARALAEALGRETDVAIRLTKRLPVAAGLGGGSADAAATLVALCRLWGVADGAVDLAAIGQALGADVPVCLAGRPTIVGGIGEVLTPVPALPGAGVLLVNPGEPLSTPVVFQAREGPFSASSRFDGGGPDVAALAARLSVCSNDLAAPAQRLCPGDWRGDVRAAGLAGVPAGPHVRQRPDLLRPVRRPERRGGGCGQARTAGLVGSADPDRWGGRCLKRGSPAPNSLNFT